MSKNSKNKITLHWLIPSFFLGIAILEMPSGYYTFLRILLFGYFVFYIYNCYLKDFRNLTLVCLLFAILYNPFFPIYLYDKEIWTVINLATIFFIFFNRKKLIESGLYPKQNNPKDYVSSDIDQDSKEKQDNSQVDMGLLKDGSLDEVTKHLQNMGLRITDHGTGVAALSLASNYTAAETASHFVLISFAKEIKEIKETSNDVIKLLEYAKMTYPVIAYLKSCGQKQLIRPIQLEHDLNALTKIVIISKEQDKWIEKILNEPHSRHTLAHFVDLP